jgi:hypothetical protein
MKGGEQTMMKFMPWVLAIIASWLIAAPFLLGYSETESAMRNDVGVGAVILLGALALGWSEMRHHGLGTDMQAHRR